MGKPMTFSRTVEYLIRLASGEHAYIWAEPGLSPGEVHLLARGMGLEVKQVSKTTLNYFRK